MVTVSRYHDISCGHRVVGHESKCKNLHGHNYRIHFTIAATREVTKQGHSTYALDDIGRVVDFSVIKTLLCDWLERAWDHKMLLSTLDPMLSKVSPETQAEWGVVAVPFNPTAENMAMYLVEQVAPAVLPPDLTLIRCVIEETRKCSATYELPN